MRIRFAALALVALWSGVAPAWSEGAPPSYKVAKAASAKPSAAAALSDAEAIERANAYLNSVNMMVADFVQVGADGTRQEGRVYVDKPGKMRFQYDPPATVEIIADGRSVAIHDLKLNKQDLYFIGQTPMKFLLKDNLDLAKDVTVLDVASTPKTTAIKIEDKATFGGTSRITLFFDTATFQLRQWTVFDPQGYETTVSLFNVDLTKKPDPALFQINERLGH
jgi:outer membrane lipoprotein-sorting protein